MTRKGLYLSFGIAKGRLTEPRAAWQEGGPRPPADQLVRRRTGLLPDCLVVLVLRRRKALRRIRVVQGDSGDRIGERRLQGAPVLRPRQGIGMLDDVDGCGEVRGVGHR